MQASLPGKDRAGLATVPPPASPLEPDLAPDSTLDSLQQAGRVLWLLLPWLALDAG